EEFPSRKLAIMDADGDGDNDVVQIGEKVLDGRTGKVLYESKGRSGDCSLFTVDEEGKAQIHYVDISNGRLSYSDDEGKVIFETEAPLSLIKTNPPRNDIPGDETVIDPYEVDENAPCSEAVLVKLTDDGPAFLAVVASYIGLPRSNLYIFDPAGALVYDELLPEEAETIEVMPTENGRVDLLVGGKDTIWRYAKNPAG